MTSNCPSLMPLKASAVVLTGLDSQFFSTREPDSDVNTEKNLSLGDPQVSVGAAQLCYRTLQSAGFMWLCLECWLAGIV